MAVQNVNSFLTAALARSNNVLGTRLTRLATQSRLTSPAVDPAALGASLRFLSQLSDLSATSRAVNQTRGVLAAADAGLSQVSTALDDVRRLEVQSLFATGTERSVLQSALNNTLQQIDRDLSSTRFGSTNLSNAVIRTSNDSAAALSNIAITQVAGTSTNGTPVNVVVQSTGTQAQSAITNLAAIASSQSFEFDLRGSEGSARINVGQGASIDSVAAQVNAQTSRTGVSASVTGADLTLSSVLAGSNQFVTITDSSGVGLAAGQSFGTDARVSVNGVNAPAQGNLVSFNIAGGISGSFVVAATTPPATSTSFTLEGGGLRVPDNLSGGARTIGIPAFSSQLGASSGVGSLGSLIGSGGSSGDRLAILNAAQSEVLTGRVQLGLADQSLNRLGALASRQAESVSAANAEVAGVNFVEEVVGLNQAANQQRIQIELIRRSNANQGSLLRILP